MKLKKCSKCGRILPENMFSKGKKSNHYCKTCRRDYMWQYSYGISPEQYLELFEAQDGKCKICGYVPKENEYLVVDHNKETGEVRGLLCKKCNLGIGYLKDNPESLRNAAKYVENICQEQ